MQIKQAEQPARASLNFRKTSKKRAQHSLPASPITFPFRP